MIIVYLSITFIEGAILLYNPISQKLYTNEKKFLKKVFCPYKYQWDDLSAVNGTTNRFCESCSTSIIDTKDMDDSEIESLIYKNPDVCLKIDLNQTNIRMVTHV